VTQAHQIVLGLVGQHDADLPIGAEQVPGDLLVVDARGLHQVADGQGFVLTMPGAPGFEHLEGRHAIGELSAAFDAHFAVGVDGRNA